MSKLEEAEVEDDMRPEYDFHPDVVMETLAPDVAQAFPDAESVNEALRVLLKAAQRAKPAA